MPGLVFEATPAQDRFAEAVFSERYRYLAFGGAIRGGKTYAILALLFALCKVFPGSRWAVVRKDLPTLRRNTVPTIEKLRPSNFMGPLNQSRWSYPCTNGSELLLFPESIKDDPDLDRWKGLEVNGFALEEANELNEKSFYKAIERAGSWQLDGADPLPLILLTFNPAANWVKRIFYDPYITGALDVPYFFQPATIADNPHLSPEYRASLENLRDADYRRFVKGEWDAIQDPDQLISFEWVKRGMEHERIPGKKALGVDVARFGDDKTVLCDVETDTAGATAHKFHVYDGLSIDRTWAYVEQAMRNGPVDADRVRVDTVGVGGGVADIGKSKGFKVAEIVSGDKAPEIVGSFYKFKNLRSFMWWQVREMLRTERLALLDCPPKLIEDLTSPRYEISGDKTIAVESKDDIKKRIGRSTDYGDALVYALYEKPKHKWDLV